MSMLEVSNLRRTFGGLTAVRDVSFTVEEGDLLALIGPNGAGKTTLFNVVSGVLKPSAGTVRFLGHDIAGLRSSRIVRYGLCRTFQSATLYPDVSVVENVVRGAFSSHPVGFWNGLVPSRWRPAAEARAVATLDLFGLAPRAGLLARELSYGEQRRLGVAIGLASSRRSRQGGPG